MSDGFSARPTMFTLKGPKEIRKSSLNKFLEFAASNSINLIQVTLLSLLIGRVKQM